jgi:hypothetical protein
MRAKGRIGDQITKEREGDTSTNKTSQQQNKPSKTTEQPWHGYSDGVQILDIEPVVPIHFIQLMSAKAKQKAACHTPPGLTCGRTR